MSQDKEKRNDNLDGSIFALLFFGWLSLYLGSSSGHGSIYHTFGIINCIAPGVLVIFSTPDTAVAITGLLIIGFFCGSIYLIKEEGFLRGVINVVFLFISCGFSTDIVDLVAQKKKQLAELDTIRDDLYKKAMDINAEKEAISERVIDLKKREERIKRLEEEWNANVEEKKKLIAEQVQIICDQQRQIKEIRSIKDKLRSGIEQEIYGMEETTNPDTAITLVSRMESHQDHDFDNDFNEEEFRSRFRDFGTDNADRYNNTNKTKQEAKSIKDIYSAVSAVSTVLSIGAFIFRVFRRRSLFLLVC